MSTPDNDTELEASSSPSSTVPRRKTPRPGRVSSGLALIFSFAALLATIYLWYALVYERPELMKLDLPRALADVESVAGETRQALDDAEDQIGQLAETQNTLKAAVEKIQTDLGRNQAQWMISEAEQLLLIANRRLQLARDASSALAALRAADRQLEQIASPSLLPVRREIAREIAVLETLERADVAGITLRLGTLADGVDQLPLDADMRLTAEQRAGAQIAQASPDAQDSPSMWKDLLSLVRIRRHDSAPRPPLPPEQQYYARENLRLMLYGAQHALLQGNAATYQHNLKAAQRWIADYFDGDAEIVGSMLAEIQTMQGTPIMGQLPDIAPSLELLRKVSGRKAAS